MFSIILTIRTKTTRFSLIESNTSKEGRDWKLVEERFPTSAWALKAEMVIH